MTRRTAVADRSALALFGLVVTAVGLLAVDWRTGTVLDLPRQVDAAPVRDLLATAWWPWVSAAAGGVLGVLGVAWLLAHLPRRGPSRARLAASDQAGTLEVDLRALASSVAERFGELAPVSSVRGSATRARGHGLLEIRARVEPDAHTQTLTAAVRRCTSEVEDALGGEVTLRILLDGPRRPRRTGRQSDRVRVQ